MALSLRFLPWGSFLKAPFPLGSLLKAHSTFYKSIYIKDECSLRKRTMKRPVKPVIT